MDHIPQRCEKIRKITGSLTKEKFYEEEDKQDLIVYSLQTIGEATTHISEKLKKNTLKYHGRKSRISEMS